MWNRDLRRRNVTMSLYDGLSTSLQSSDRLWDTSQRLFFVDGQATVGLG